MRRTSSLLVASVLGLSWTATGAIAADWSNELGSHADVELRIQTIQDPFIDALKNIEPDFENLTGANLTTEGFGYDPLHEKQILSCSQNDDQYDVIFVDGIWVGEFVEAGCIDPVEARIGETDPAIIAWDDYIESFAGQAVWDGKRQCLPVAGYWHMLHYRKDLFDKAGLKVPETFEEVMETAKFFTDNPDYPGVYGYAMNMQRGSAAGQQFFEWIYSAGGKPWVSNYPGSPDAYADQTPMFNSPPAVDMVQYFHDMVQYGPPGVQQFAWDERANAFTQGQVAMINNWSVRTPLFQDPNISKVVGKFDVAMFPHAKGQKSVPPVGGWIMCINAHSKNKEAAWDFMKWFGSPEIHKQWVLMGGPASRHSTMQDAEVIAAQPWTPTLYESSKAAWSELRPRHALTFEMIDALGLEVNRAIVGDESAQAAMDAANAKITRMLKSEGYIK